METRRSGRVMTTGAFVKVSASSGPLPRKCLAAVNAETSPGRGVAIPTACQLAVKLDPGLREHTVLLPGHIRPEHAPYTADASLTPRVAAFGIALARSECGLPPLLAKCSQAIFNALAKSRLEYCRILVA